MAESIRDPSLGAVRLFLAAAECGSFSKAAELFGMPQSSVTRRIAALERSLACRLFERHRRGVMLTIEGREYHAEVAPAIDRIAAANRRMRRRDQAHVLRLRVYPTFAARWLIRRLPSFEAWAPGISLSLDSNAAQIDFDRCDADIAIQFGGGSWPGLNAEFLFPDEVEPICAPALLATVGPLDRVDDLARFLLLQSRYRRDDWKAWLEANAELWPQIRTMEFPSSILTYQACLDGLGVAMGQPLLIESELADGRLVRPLGSPLRRPGMGYYLLSPQTREMPLAARKFRAWMRSLAEPSDPAVARMP